MDMWQNVINGRDYDMSIEAHESDRRDPRAGSTIAGPAFLAEVRRVVEGGRLDETFIDAHGSTPEVFTYGGLIAHVLTFAAHRRILVLGALEIRRRPRPRQRRPAQVGRRGGLTGALAT